MSDNAAKKHATTEHATLTFWVPERVDILLSEHERRKGVSRSGFMRVIMRRHLYGLYGAPPSHIRTDVSARPRTGKRGAWGGRIPELGKNTVEVKLSLPRMWRDDLAALAAGADITLSHFAREVVVTHLLGHAYLPSRAIDLHTQDTQQDQGKRLRVDNERRSVRTPVQPGQRKQQDHEPSFDDTQTTDTTRD